MSGRDAKVGGVEEIPGDAPGENHETVDRLHPLLARRWSPRVFDPEHELTEAEVALLLEAARWAPSAGNSQPWAFHAARRGTPEHAALVPLLAGSSAPWASTASLLLVNLCHELVEDTDWEYSEFSRYDLGQAVAHLTIQGEAMGLACRQFRAFDRDAITALLDVPEHWSVLTMAAVGRPAPEAERGPRASTRTTQVTWPREDDR